MRPLHTRCHVDHLQLLTFPITMIHRTNCVCVCVCVRSTPIGSLANRLVVLVDQHGTETGRERYF